MKKIVGWPLTWGLYYMGNFTSNYIMNWFPRAYLLYSKLMVWSLSVQEWSGLERPWREPTEEEKKKRYET